MLRRIILANLILAILLTHERFAQLPRLRSDLNGFDRGLVPHGAADLRGRLEPMART
jgi:hypothetical protein